MGSPRGWASILIKFHELPQRVKHLISLVWLKELLCDLI